MGISPTVRSLGVSENGYSPETANLSQKKMMINHDQPSDLGGHHSVAYFQTKPSQIVTGNDRDSSPGEIRKLEW